MLEPEPEEPELEELLELDLLGELEELELTLVDELEELELEADLLRLGVEAVDPPAVDELGGVVEALADDAGAAVFEATCVFTAPAALARAVLSA